MTFEMQRKYSVPSNPESRAFSGTASEDLHAWSIYRWENVIQVELHEGWVFEQTFFESVNSENVIFSTELYWAE